MAAHSPKISVVMPVYNAEQYLIEAIDSILSQTFIDFEFIIVNDGSTDSSSEIIDAYVKNDSRVIHVKNENQGISLSLNHGINIAKGEYIARMDADDISLSNRFDEQVKFMDNNPDVGICGTWVDLFGDIIKGQSICHPTDNEKLKVRLFFSVCFVHPSVMIRKKLLIENDIIYDSSFSSGQDYKLWFDLKNLTKYANIPLILLRYRVTKNSVSNVANSNKSDIRYNLISSVFILMLKELNVDISEHESRRHFQLGLNSRLRVADFDLDSLGSYLINILRKNIENQLYQNLYLTSFLSEKYAYAVIFKALSRKGFSFKGVSFYLFFKGSLQVLKSQFVRRYRAFRFI